MEWIGGADGFLRIVDQRVLPDELKFLDLHSVPEVAEAIRTLAVRGAPAIGIAAAYGLAIGAVANRPAIERFTSELAATRPTAVNLFWALERMKKTAAANAGTADDDFAAMLLAEARTIHLEDLESCRRIGHNGAALLPETAAVLTHCNAGALATGGYGTALGILRSARKAGKNLKVYADETRPLLQGARLTAWELAEDGFDVTLITDSMAAALMQNHRIDAVIVGADRIARNGDAANKIGTYGLAVVAKHHGVPLYVAAPKSTFDPAIASGEEIPIEERSGDEIRILPGGKLVPEHIKVWNPAFDVTPAKLIDAIVTENGVYKYPFDF